MVWPWRHQPDFEGQRAPVAGEFHRFSNRLKKISDERNSLSTERRNLRMIFSQGRDENQILVNLKFKYCEETSLNRMALGRAERFLPNRPASGTRAPETLIPTKVERLTNQQIVIAKGIHWIDKMTSEFQLVIKHLWNGALHKWYLIETQERQTPEYLN